MIQGALIAFVFFIMGFLCSGFASTEINKDTMKQTFKEILRERLAKQDELEKQ